MHLRYSLSTEGSKEADGLIAGAGPSGSDGAPWTPDTSTRRGGVGAGPPGFCSRAMVAVGEGGGSQVWSLVDRMTCGDFSQRC